MSIKPYYEHAGITIYHGDCREILPQISKADLVLTDPPYGLNIAAEPFNSQRRAGQVDKAWDNSPVDDLYGLIRDAGEALVVWGGNYYPLPPSRGWFTWYKPDAPPSMAHFEMAWTNLDINARQISQSIAKTNAERVGHPTQKPLAVMKWCIAQVKRDIKTIIDPFMGSGTTLVAAKESGITAVGIELDEEYCEKAAKRLSQEVLSFAC
jgi:site-specific DNA-methyltransferase (adenine-specific)